MDGLWYYTNKDYYTQTTTTTSTTSTTTTTTSSTTTTTSSTTTTTITTTTVPTTTSTTTTTTTTTTTVPTTTTTIPPSSKIIIVQMDDCQDNWLEDTCANVVNLHIQKNADISVGFIPYGMTQDNSWKPYLQNWNNNYKGLVEIVQHSYDHSSQYIGWSAQSIANDIQKGLDLFAQWGIRPYTFIPAYGWAENTAEGANLAGFHSVLAGIENPYDEGWVGNVLVIDDGVLCGYYSDSCVNKEYNSLKAMIDDVIAKKGYSVLQFHQQDFGEIGSSQYNAFYSKWSSTLDKFKDDGYTFMTADEYYQASHDDALLQTKGIIFYSRNRSSE